MKIGFSGYSKIEGERFEVPPPKGLRVDVRMNVIAYEAQPDGSFRVRFSLHVQYGNLGMLRLDGYLKVEDVEESLRKRWLREGKIPEEAMVQIHTTLTRICIPDAVVFSKFLNLPPPVPLPVPPQAKKRKEDRGWEVGFA